MCIPWEELSVVLDDSFDSTWQVIVGDDLSVDHAILALGIAVLHLPNSGSPWDKVS
jgi:hypothetical protein